MIAVKSGVDVELRDPAVFGVCVAIIVYAGNLPLLHVSFMLIFDCQILTLAG